MRFLKKLDGGNANQDMHNNEDARVNVSTAPQQKDKQGKSVKTKAAKAVQVMKRIPYYVWLWEKAGEAWGWVCEHAESILEVIS
ncbi:hypothetical protein D3C81_798740 [compost metagenome]